MAARMNRRLFGMLSKRLDELGLDEIDDTRDVFELALVFSLVTYDAGACSAHNATLVRARDLHYLFGLTAGQPTLLQDAKHWLGSRAAAEADAVSDDLVRGHRVARRLFIGQVTVLLDGWEHLRTVLRIQN